MSLFNRVKKNLAGRAGGQLSQILEQPKRNSYTVRLPNPFGGAPLCQATVAVTSTRHAEGQSLRIKAYMDGNFRASPIESTVTALDGGERVDGGLRRASSQAVRRLAQRGLSRLSMPDRRVRTWIDIQTSTAPLASGAEALLPEQVRDLCGGSLQRRRQGEPRIGLFMGPAGHVAHAQLGVVQLDQDDMPQPYRGRPFSLIASVASLNEPAMDDVS